MRAYRHLRVRLKKADRDKLDDMLSGGIQPVRTVLRALALSHLHEGKSVSEVAETVRLTPKAVREIGRRLRRFWPGTGSLRQAAAGRGGGAGRQPEATHHRHGLQ